jgi:hypothetical protein
MMYLIPIVCLAVLAVTTHIAIRSLEEMVRNLEARLDALEKGTGIPPALAKPKPE